MFNVYLAAVESSTEGRKDESEQLGLRKRRVGLGGRCRGGHPYHHKPDLTGLRLPVFTATDGEDAVAIYAQHRDEIAVVLTDMMMPVMDDEAMVHALRRIDSTVKIITASGLNVIGGMDKLSGGEIKHFLLKPYTAKTLLKTLRTILDDPYFSGEAATLPSKVSDQVPSA
jgi:CheY-like chemotaxis protein